MMGRRKSEQGQLFYAFDLEAIVPDDHQVRRIASVLDLSWVRAELAPHYSHTGRPSIDPELMLRMLIVGYVFAIRSERALPNVSCRLALQHNRGGDSTIATDRINDCCQVLRCWNEHLEYEAVIAGGPVDFCDVRRLHESLEAGPDVFVRGLEPDDRQHAKSERFIVEPDAIA